MLIPGVDDRITLSALSLLVGFALTRLADQLRARDQRRDAAKSVALPLLAIANALDMHRKMLDDALSRDREALRAYYKFVFELVPQADLKELDNQMRSNVRLPHDALTALRTAHQNTLRAYDRHDQLRNTLEMSETPTSNGEGYSRLVVSAGQAVRGGLEHLEQLGPSDTRRAIAAFMRKRG